MDLKSIQSLVAKYIPGGTITERKFDWLVNSHKESFNVIIFYDFCCHGDFVAVIRKNNLIHFVFYK